MPLVVIRCGSPLGLYTPGAVDWGIGLALIVQAAALALLFWRVGGNWMSHAGAVFIILATAYHGLNEVLIWIVPDRDYYRVFVNPSDVETFVIWISFAILLLSCTYVFALGRPVEVKPPREDVRRIFDWRLMLAAAVPLLVLTLAGNGFAVSAGNSASTTPLGTAAGLASQFLVLSLVLASLGFIVRFGRRWLLPVLAIQAMAMAIVGSRLAVLIVSVLLLYSLARLGIKLQRRQLVYGLTAFAVAAVVITSARATQGHLSSTSSGDLRLSYIAAGFGNIGSTTFWNQLSFDVGHRLDGNSFGAMELVALNAGYPSLGSTPLVNDVLLAVPSFLNPRKVYAPIETRSEKEYAEVYFRLPLPYVAPGLHEDILPTQLGATIGFWGPGGMLLIATLLGGIFGRADRWLLSRWTPSRFVIGLGLMSCVLYYEGSWNIYPVTFRGVAVLLGLVLVIQRLVVKRPKTVDPIVARAVEDAARLRTRPADGFR